MRTSLILRYGESLVNGLRYIPCNDSFVASQYALLTGYELVTRIANENIESYLRLEVIFYIDFMWPENITQNGTIAVVSGRGRCDVGH